MRPFYFGDAGRELFGVYHAPLRDPPRRSAVLLCHAICHEYMKTHWAIRRLALGLAGLGFPVLKFDYRGCGDSSGESGDWSLDRWREDVVTAAAELRRLAGTSEMTIVGLRVGACVAARATADIPDVRELVLWNPVVKGVDYMRDHRLWQEEGRRWRLSRYVETPEPEQGTACHGPGFAMNAVFPRAMEALDLAAEVARIRAARVLLTLSEPTPEYDRLREALDQAGLPAECRIIPEAGNWDDLHSRRGEWLTTRMPHAIANVLAEETE
jgi:pimeloyl-ACP methyl ester carboxylesterase